MDIKFYARRFIHLIDACHVITIFAIIMSNHDFIIPKVKICIRGLGNESYL